ncbi:hypothetical protein [Nocardia sp. NPDC020380]|uniref:hypothetical protein n=1 Tax=Nocardia sp. NPDC020380 TaxID=3364309 RepID=UPI00379EA90D
MPSFQHEGLVELFRTQPTLAAGFLADVFDVAIPDFAAARTESCDFTDIGPREFRGDTAFVLSDGTATPLLGIVVEIQLGKDETRKWSWPVYVSTLRARLQCPTYLLVVSPDPTVATWSRRPIELGHPGLVLRPLVLGPELIPAVTDPKLAIDVPERAVLSAIAHADSEQADAIFTALLAGLQETDDEHGRMYYDLVLAALSTTAKKRLEAMMAIKYEYQSDFARRYVAEGRAEGVARAVLTVLEARGVYVSQTSEDRIRQCKEPELLEIWLRRAATAESADDLFV